MGASFTVDLSCQGKYIHFDSDIGKVMTLEVCGKNIMFGASTCTVLGSEIPFLCSKCQVSCLEC